MGCRVPRRSAKSATNGSKNTLTKVAEPMMIPILSDVSPWYTSQTGKNGKVMPTIAK